MRGEKLIRRYNNLNGKLVGRTTLERFHKEITGELLSKRIDSHSPLGIEIIGIEKRLSKALETPLEKFKLVVDKPVNVDAYVKAKKVIAVRKPSPALNGCEPSMLDGLEYLNDQLVETSLGNLNDVYSMITDMILKAIKKGGLIWQKQWNASKNPSGLAHNYVTKSYYSGANSYLNWIPPMEGYTSPYFFTMKQVDKLGGRVVKGGKMWPVVYYKDLYIDNRTKKSITEAHAKSLIESMHLKSKGYKAWYNAAGELIIKVVPAMFYYGVFNYEDTTGLKVKEFVPVVRSEKQTIESAEEIVENMPKKPPIKYGGDDAYYRPSTDSIQMPLIGSFKKEQNFYSVQFHELIHSTGHESRVGRKFGRKDTPEYSLEELIAELGASFLCAESGILFHTLHDTAAYLDMYQQSLSDDPKFFFHASAAAQKAANFILNKDAGKKKTKKKFKKEVTSDSPADTKVVKASKSARESKEPRPPVERKEHSQAIRKRSHSGPVAGFLTADKKPEKTEAKIFRFHGELGKLFGEQQRYRCQIVIDGEKHSSKSELLKQLADACIDLGFKTALLEYEMGGLQSKDTQAGIERNVKEGNRKKLFVAPDDFPTTVDAIKGIADKFDAILIDSGSKVGEVTNEWLDELRTEYPDTIWIILMHQNSKGGTKGGTAAGYNAPVIVRTYRPDQTNPLKNYAYVEKNRGNMTDKWYLIATHKVVMHDPGNEYK